MATSYWEEVAWHQRDEPEPETDRSSERGLRARGPDGDQWGRSESIDPDNVGDIADEGAGHRG